MKNEGPFSVCDLPVMDGRIYHLDLKSEELAKDIIIVGDPERTPFIADEFFATREVDRCHRGLRTITGIVGETSQRVSVITSGMGTPSLEIVLNEIVALNEIDFQTKRRKGEYDMMNIIRVGTSGGLQPDTKLGTNIITEYALGLDNTGLFYHFLPYDEECRKLEDRIRKTINRAVRRDSRFRGKIFPYASKANQNVSEALDRAAKESDIKFKRGITVSSSGFFANQGRNISRLTLTVPEIERVLASFNTGIKGLKIENMEMEASFLLYFMGALGYRAGAICPTIANRYRNTLKTRYTQNLRDAARVALKALDNL